MNTETTGGAMAGRRVLIIDDNEDLALSQASLLQYHGCRVEVAADGWEGLRMATQRPHDIVFIDIGLPRMSGYDVVRAIRSTLADPPVLLAQTAYGLPEDIRKSLEAGFDAHLVKPVDPSEIIRLVLEGRSGLKRTGPGSGRGSGPGSDDGASPAPPPRNIHPLIPPSSDPQSAVALRFA